jgi:hypothetical protein
MSTHRDVHKLTSFACSDCDFEQIKVGGGIKWLKLVGRLHKKKCKKTGRTKEMTTSETLILASNCGGKLGNSKNFISRQGIDGNKMATEKHYSSTYDQKLAVFKDLMTQKVQEQLKFGKIAGVLDGKKLGKPRMLNLSVGGETEYLIGQQKVTSTPTDMKTRFHHKEPDMKPDSLMKIDVEALKTATNIKMLQEKCARAAIELMG